MAGTAASEGAAYGAYGGGSSASSYLVKSCACNASRGLMGAHCRAQNSRALELIFKEGCPGTNMSALPCTYKVL
eukprot:1162024-Pelagomonas_calceolata.AAC.10